MKNEKRKYVTPLTMKTYCIKCESGFLASSINPVETKEITINAYTDNYESKDSNWDNISFE